MMKRSAAFSLDATDWKKSLRDIAFVVVGQVVAFLPHWFESTDYDFGDYKPFVGLIVTAVVMLGNRFLRDNSKVGVLLLAFSLALAASTADAGVFLHFGFTPGPASQAAAQRRQHAHERAMQRSNQQHIERVNREMRYAPRYQPPAVYYYVPAR
jgi:hypothetical protein